MIDDASETCEDLFSYLGDLDGLPPAVILTNVPSSIFVNQDQKSEFEREMQMDLPGDCVQFDYFKSFRRVRVRYPDVKYAAVARIRCHNIAFLGSELKCFFAQSAEIVEPYVGQGSESLELPALEKQFLISPPASPPVGWEQSHEMAPVADPAVKSPVNLDLLTARLASYVASDGEITEVQAPTKSAPGIVVYPCDDGETDESFIRPKIQPTPRPSRTSSRADSISDEMQGDVQDAESKDCDHPMDPF